MNKSLRQRAILELVHESPVASQEDFQRVLKKRGFAVGQATLSRDIRELGLVKTGDGYTVAQSDNPYDPALPPVAQLVRDFVLNVRAAENLIVTKTSIGSAQPVAAALDGEGWPEAIGSIAGDDTILIICANKKAARKIEGRIQEMLA
jgi:transcriptional regulator of arginine metabolism